MVSGYIVFDDINVHHFRVELKSSERSSQNERSLRRRRLSHRHPLNFPT